MGRFDGVLLFQRPDSLLKEMQIFGFKRGNIKTDSGPVVGKPLNKKPRTTKKWLDAKIIEEDAETSK